jgi:hypothetical protein
MAVVPAIRNSSASDEIWQGLKQAIANSAGFQGWQAEQLKQSDSLLREMPLEQQVSLFLRETLATLAY